MKWFALILALPLLLITGGLLLNRPPLLSSPGLIERLSIYLTTNVAETRLDHQFPELRPPLIPAGKEQAQEVVLTAVRSLGWQEILVTDGEVRAVAVSPLLRFRDDITVRLEGKAEGTLLHARSASRVGKGEFHACRQRRQPRSGGALNMKKLNLNGESVGIEDRFGTTRGRGTRM